MPLIELNVNPTDRQLRQFAGIVIPLLAVLWRPCSGGELPAARRASGCLCPAVAPRGSLHLVVFLRPALARPIYVGWMYAAYPIGWVIGHVVIGVVFFLVLTPIGLVMRALRSRSPATQIRRVACELLGETLAARTDTIRHVIFGNSE